MIPALLLMLAQAGAASTPPTLDNCVGVTTRPDGEVFGDRAVVSADGRSLVMQCGDGRVISWREGRESAVGGKATLFEAARAEQLLPDWASCPWPAILGPAYPGVPDCDLVDQTIDGNALVVSKGVDQFVLRRGKPSLELKSDRLAGILMPRRSPDRVVLVDRRKLPEMLETMPLSGIRSRRLATLATSDLIFEEGEGQANEMVYARRPDLLLVTFGGAFRVADEIAMMRAYTPDGIERWSLRRPLPPRDESDIVGDYASLFILHGGAIGAMRRTSDRTRFDLIDLATGTVIATMPGWPIAASREAGLIIVRTGPERVELRTVDVPR